MINPFPHAMWRMPYFLHVLELKQTNKQKKNASSILSNLNVIFLHLQVVSAGELVTASLGVPVTLLFVFSVLLLIMFFSSLDICHRLM